MLVRGKVGVHVLERIDRTEEDRGPGSGRGASGWRQSAGRRAGPRQVCDLPHFFVNSLTTVFD